MRVLIDFTQIPLDRTGVGVYADNLVANLIPLLREEDALIVVAQGDDAIIRETVKSRANVQLVTIPSNIFRSRALLFGFEQFILPILGLLLRADLIHSLHYTHPLFSFSRRIVTIHDLTFFLFPELHTRGRRIIMQLFIRRAMKYTEGLIFVSKSTEHDAERMLPTGCNFRFVVPLGVSLIPPLTSPEIIPDRIHAILGKDLRYLLFVGTLEPRKNIIRIVHAFERVAESYSDLQLVFAGKLGWYTEDIAETINNSPQRARIHQLGFVSEAEKLSLLHNCAALVYPSLYEGFGLPILEGMAAGAPVITSNISSMPEVAGEAAILVDPGSVESIAHAIQQLLDEQIKGEVRRRLGIINAGNYTWEKTAQRTYEAYQRVISNR